MAAKMSVLGLILSSNPYLRSAVVRFPLVQIGPYWCKLVFNVQMSELVPLNKLVLICPKLSISVQIGSNMAQLV